MPSRDAASARELPNESGGDPGEVIRRYLQHSVVSKFPPVTASAARASTQAASDALDALLSENRRLREEIRIREESQIPVIPHGAAVQLERLQVENAHYRETLEGIAADTQRTVSGLQGWAREALRRA